MYKEEEKAKKWNQMFIAIFFSGVSWIAQQWNNGITDQEQPLLSLNTNKMSQTNYQPVI